MLRGARLRLNSVVRLTWSPATTRDTLIFIPLPDSRRFASADYLLTQFSNKKWTLSPNRLSLLGPYEVQLEDPSALRGHYPTGMCRIA